ncbi:MAG TPA: hypothetical protein VGE50_08680 [Gammaproteobacteria bacterium]
MRKRKPDILIVLAVLIGLGIVTTKVVQAYTGEAKPVVAATR